MTEGPATGSVGYESRMAGMMTRYGTPLAVFLVLLGLWAAPFSARVRAACGAAIGFGVLFNLVMLRVLIGRQARSPGIVLFRLFTNLSVNVALVYLMGGLWRPIWLLLALTPLATALYESRSKTLVSAASVSLLLLSVSLIRGIETRVEWMEVFAYAAFIMVFSLLLNELSGRSPAPRPPEGD